jgi:hypothetical protein
VTILIEEKAPLNTRFPHIYLALHRAASLFTCLCRRIYAQAVGLAAVEDGAALVVDGVGVGRVGADPGVGHRRRDGRGDGVILGKGIEKTCAVASRNPLLHDGATNATWSPRLDSEAVPPCRSRVFGAELGGSLATPNF